MDREKIKKKIFFWYSILWVALFVALYQGYLVYFVDTTSTKSKWIGLFAGAIALLLATCKGIENAYFCHKNPKIEEVIKYFQNGTKIFYKTSAKFVIFFAFILGIFLYKFLGSKYIICYSTGVFTMLFCLFINNILSISNIVKISYSTSNQSNQSTKLAHNFAIAISFFSISFIIISMVILYHIFKDYQILNGYVLGIATISIFYTLVNTITKKAAKNAASTFVELQENFDENDKRSPLLLLNGICKGISNINILSCELSEIFSAALISSMTVGGYCYNLMGAFLPIIICSSGLFASIIVILFTKITKSTNIARKLFISEFFSITIFCLISFYLIKTWIPQEINVTFSIITGALMGYILCFVNFNRISDKYKPVKNIVYSTSTGSNNVIQQTIKEGFKSTFLPVLIIAIALILAFLFAYGIQAPAFGIYGITLAILSSICAIGINSSIGIYSLICENISHFEQNYEKNIPYSNNNKKCLKESSYNLLAMIKNFITSNNIITTICILIAYSILVEIEQIDILNPYVMASLLIGAILPFLFSGLILSNSIKLTGKLIVEAKKQIRHFPSILNFEMRPNYEDIVSKGAINGSVKGIFIIFILILIFALISYNLKQEALGGLITGSILGSIGLILTLSNSANSIKSAKKYFKQEYRNAAYMEEYGAISNTDIMFNLFNDLITPNLCSIVKFIAILALAIAPMYL